MLPYSTLERKQRDISRNRWPHGGNPTLIGRLPRAVIDLETSQNTSA
jgi:hypothetical protein